jgi:maltooligosyltrehalose trehalohydrolase
VWAPKCRRVEVVSEPGDEAPGPVALAAEGDGYFSGVAPQARAGTRYRYRLDGGDALPDPASRFQPEGVHGPSEVVDPSLFEWTDDGWGGVGPEGQVLYELHVGTFTPEGTWAAAAQQLPALADLGVTCLEVMPVAAFDGRFGWGYDGVDLFAPFHGYGRPDDFRAFVDRAHAEGLGVLLDVVYNHFGPSGNYLRPFSDAYFTDRYTNEWGEAINFDGPDAGPVRDFFVANAGYWIAEFHLDGLRLDATQSIHDFSGDHILKAVGRRVREAADGRRTLVVAENEPQETRLVRPVEQGGYGLDALWNDDLHHSAVVALTGHNEAYYTDYLGAPQEFISAAKWGYLYQGQRYGWQRQRRGTPALDLPPTAFVTFIENHDQVANTDSGLRLHTRTSPGRHRALTAFLLLGPGTPMLFQGQEFASSRPFLYFADHQPALAEAVRKGRGDFMKQFRSLTSEEVQARLPDPAAPATFARCKLDWAERERHPETVALHRDLLRLRREDPVFRTMQRRGAVDGAVLGPEAFCLRYFSDGDGSEGDRLLVVNLGRDLLLVPAPEPLLAPLAGMGWDVLWSSENPKYGGGGTAPLETDEGWRLPGHAAVVLAPSPDAALRPDPTVHP